MSVVTNDKIVPRFCRLQRGSREDQYGFDFKTLKSEGKHIATNVRDSYPAQKAGLKNGDYILEVNGKSIEGMEHEAVVSHIFSNVKQVDLLVVEDLKGYKKARKQQEKLMQQVIAEKKQFEVDHSRNISRHRIHLLPTYKGIGLHLNYDGVINFIEPSSPAELAGLRKDQKIVEVNDRNVRGKTNREIAAIIKENISDLVIGVESTVRENVIDSTVDISASPKLQQQTPPERDTTIKKLIEANVIIPSEEQQAQQEVTPVPQQQTPKIRPVDENIFMQSKAVSENVLNQIDIEASPSLSISKGKKPVSSKFFFKKIFIFKLKLIYENNKKKSFIFSNNNF